MINRWVVILVLVSFPGLPRLSAEPLTPGLLRHAGDYGCMWWPYGWRGRGPDGHRVFCVQTNAYGIAFDVDSGSLVRAGVLEPAPSEDEALIAGNNAVFDLPRVNLSVRLSAGGRAYRASAVAPKVEDVRIIEHGRFLQRIEMLNVKFEDEEGAVFDDADADFELVCWPDRFSLILHLKPRVALADARIEMSIDAADERLRLGSRTDRAVLLEQREGHGGGLAVLRAPGSEWIEAIDGKPGTIRVGTVSRWHGPVEKNVTMTAGLIFLAHAGNDGRPLSRRVAMELSSREDVAVRAQGLVPYAHPLESSYDPLRGCYRVELGNHARGRWTPQKDQDLLERVALTIQNPDDAPRTMRLVFARDKRDEFPGIIGMTPMLRDAEGFPTGLPVQISKNWHVSPPWFRGPTMLELAPGAIQDLEFAITYANWGGVPAVSHAQLCLVGWGVNQLWHQVAISSFGEVLCYDPDVNLNRAMIDDVRPLLVAPMGSAATSPARVLGWTNNVGGGDFLVLIGMDGQRDHLARMRTRYTRYGPNLAEVTYAGQGAAGRIDARMTVMHYRSDDITRGLYRLRYDCREPVRFSRMAFFQLGADHYNNHQFRSIARGNEAGLLEEWAPEAEGAGYERRDLSCEGEVPWFSLHGAIPNPRQGGAWANRGFVIRSWRARLGGRDAPHATAGVHRTRDGNLSSVLVELVPPSGLEALQAGDFVEADIELMVLPMSTDDYRGPNQALRAALTEQADTWRMVHREAVGNRLQLAARHGRVESVYPTRVACDPTGQAEFTVQGGVGFLPVTISGIRDYRRHTLERRSGADWIAVDQAVHGNDFWQADYHPGSATWDLSFNINADRATGAEPLTLRLQ